MLQNELKAMLNEEECIGVPADEEYQEYLIDYIPVSYTHLTLPTKA